MSILRRVVLSGFKSIKTMDLEFRALNVLIGANGAGKSNFVSFFKMLNAMTKGPDGGLQNYVASVGQCIPCFIMARNKTPPIEAKLDVLDQREMSVSTFRRLIHVAGDTLAFDDEYLTPDTNGRQRHEESNYISRNIRNSSHRHARRGDATAKLILPASRMSRLPFP